MPGVLQITRGSQYYVTANGSKTNTFSEDSFDIIVAEDIFEHLHNNVLRKVLENCFLWLKPGGHLIFHTFPTRFDYIFHDSKWWIPLALFARITDNKFSHLVDIYHRHLLNPWRKLRAGKTFEE